MSNYDEVPELKAGKRLGVQRCPWMGDWFVSWSPRNSNQNAEGPWAQWAHMAAMILSHPATKEAAPDLYRPELAQLACYDFPGEPLSDERVEALFKKGAA